MLTWWDGLSPLNQVFWGLVVFFTTLFIWQLVGSLTGLLAEPEVDVDIEGEPEMEGGEDSGGLATFRLLSIRSLLAFATLFVWAAALYLGSEPSILRALVYSAVWGLAGMLVVAAFFWFLPRLTEEGTLDLAAAVGKNGTVYIAIPGDGAGRVRTIVGDSVVYLRARSATGEAIAAGTGVRVVDVVEGSTLLVQELD